MYNVRVTGIRQDGKTGYTEVHVRAELPDGNTIHTGPEKGYCIEADTLRAHWGGEVKNWLQWVKAEHQKYHGIHDDLTDQIKGLVGSIL